MPLGASPFGPPAEHANTEYGLSPPYGAWYNAVSCMAVDMVALMVEVSVQLWVGKVLVEMSQKNGHEKENVSMVVIFT